MKKDVYKFNVLNKDAKWESWTGTFETITKAMDWFEKYGQFHIDNKHTLGLFKNRHLVNKFKN